MVDLLVSHRSEGHRLEPLELIEQGQRVAVRMKVTDLHWQGESAEVFKVFTLEGDRVALLQDCIDRDDALRKLEDPLRER